MFDWSEAFESVLTLVLTTEDMNKLISSSMEIPELFFHRQSIEKKVM